ncbi:sulfite exporter TauE/SafE family protein [Candidatus Peregrinibacteria bacterium]|nr:sulfite exporter TauE/SafE family protein [Candidatus Peregrinibacteria bacterium]
MTCASCEIMLERKLKKVPGVLSVNVDHRTGKAKIVADANALPDGEQIESLVRDAGYRLIDGSTAESSQEHHEKAVLKVCIDGMTSPHDERLLREKLKLVPGVHNASVHSHRGTANVYYKGQPPLWEHLKEAVESVGYQLRHPDEQPSVIEPPHRKWMEIGACLLIIFALYKLLSAFDILTFATSAAGATTFGGIFLIGIVAGTSSCLAVTGGLLLSVAAKYNEVHQTETRWHKFKPLLSFNIGRLVSYFLFGGLVGVIGKSIILTPTMTGYMNVIIALVMVSIALSILKILPKGKFGIRPPKALSHWVAGLAESHHPTAPFVLGAGTFFLPCGFTQSLQLIALASGSFLTGAMTMFVFALGTLPALLGISAISSTAKGTFSRFFLRFAGVLVLILALWNGRNGLLLVGIDPTSYLPQFLSQQPAYAAGKDPNVTVTSNGEQIMRLDVGRFGYKQKSFTVTAGKQTWIYATAEAGIAGCTSGLTVPKHRLAKILQPGPPNPRTGQNVLGPFTPTGNFTVSCAMGMITVPAYAEGVAVANADAGAAAPPSAAIPPNAQVVKLTWNNGYEPRTIRVKNDRPTALLVSAEVPTGGCMSFLQSREFNQATQVPKPGEPPAVLILATDKAQPGRYPLLCSMGAEMADLIVDLSMKLPE